MTCRSTTIALLLFFVVHKFSCDHGPGVELACFIQGCEKTILLTPSQILMLLVHSDEVDKVEMREGQDNNRVVVANK